ncbi:unnamed protein product [Periconia digitata]|uniref:Uncharacterized protein n=1 Tax=Periconia digitata TaxID=1303443 RepID=A0A9W4UQ54_9PLEO|nr:unnamed protein product [Periconia digitata]
MFPRTSSIGNPTHSRTQQESGKRWQWSRQERIRASGYRGNLSCKPRANQGRTIDTRGTHIHKSVRLYHVYTTHLVDTGQVSEGPPTATGRINNPSRSPCLGHVSSDRHRSRVPPSPLLHAWFSDFRDNGCRASRLNHLMNHDALRDASSYAVETFWQAFSVHPTSVVRGR